MGVVRSTGRRLLGGRVVQVHVHEVPLPTRIESVLFTALILQY